MKELFEKLRKYYFISSDPRENGVHPRCNEIWDQMEEILSDMDEDELVAYLEGLPKRIWKSFIRLWRTLQKRTGIMLKNSYGNVTALWRERIHKEVLSLQLL